MHRIDIGDCREILRTLDEASVDAIVTDPPYELGFMGKAWDSTGVAFDPETWRAAWRVLKPGGHLLGFSAARTYHRIAGAIEDAGFEIRDQIMWVYGSGFPKSMDVATSIDKTGGGGCRQELLRFTKWMRETGMSESRINELTGTFMGGHYLTSAAQPAVPTRRHFERLRPHLKVAVPDWVEALIHERSFESEDFKAREVVGIHRKAMSGWGSDGKTRYVDRPITVAHSPQAKTWEGWGTALKPAHEPIVVARKPLAGTVAANVLKYRTGALNIDACRVPSQDGGSPAQARRAAARESGRAPTHPGASDGSLRPTMVSRTSPQRYMQARPGEALGRWPANLIHDGSHEVTTAFAHAGDAARFFYCAKASRADRGEGNTHPTVKPTDLMRYLCRLVTPPGGLVLDPFAGSGSTGRAAVLEGLRFVGIELSPEYAAIARRRIAQACDPPSTV